MSESLKQAIREALTEHQAEKLVKKRFFIDGEEGSEDIFQHDVDVEYLSDVIEIALEPIKLYGNQLEGINKDCIELDAWEVGSVICALQSNAKGILEQWLKMFEKHAGFIGLKKASYNRGNRARKSGDPLPGTTVGSFIERL
jgi:hypothetical protein